MESSQEPVWNGLWTHTTFPYRIDIPASYLSPKSLNLCLNHIVLNGAGYLIWHAKKPLSYTEKVKMAAQVGWQVKSSRVKINEQSTIFRIRLTILPVNMCKVNSFHTRFMFGWQAMKLQISFPNVFFSINRKNSAANRFCSICIQEQQCTE